MHDEVRMWNVMRCPMFQGTCAILNVQNCWMPDELLILQLAQRSVSDQFGRVEACVSTLRPLLLFPAAPLMHPLAYLAI
jgi:hypothetical protein